MHAGKVETSSRLRETFAALVALRTPTTREIAVLTGSMAVHSDIAGLRANGIGIRHWQAGRLHHYALESPIYRHASVWALIEQARADVPDAEWDKLPKNLARRRAGDDEGGDGGGILGAGGGGEKISRSKGGGGRNHDRKATSRH